MAERPPQKPSKPGAKPPVPPKPSRQRARKPAPKPKKAVPKPSLAKTTPRLSEGPTLETLTRRLGAPDADLRDAIFDGIEEAALLEIGTRVDSTDILREVPRFVAEASEIERSLSTAQRECLLFSPGILAVLIDEARRLHALFCAPAAPPHPAGRAVRAEVREGLALRNNVLAAVRNALGAAAMARVEELVGLAETAGRLASGMEQLATFIDELLKIGDRHEHLRLKAFHLTSGRAQLLRDHAARLRALEDGPKPGVMPAWAVDAQRRLDLQDGRVIELMERVLRAFRAAHRQDRSIRVPELHALGWIEGSRAKEAPMPRH
jgi:hypothetical protein